MHIGPVIDLSDGREPASLLGCPSSKNSPVDNAALEAASCASRRLSFKPSSLPPNQNALRVRHIVGQVGDESWFLISTCGCHIHTSSSGAFSA